MNAACGLKLQEGELSIRSATTEDAGLLTKWWNDGKVMAHAGFPLGLGTTEEDTLSLLKKSQGPLSRLFIIEIFGIPRGEMNYRVREKNVEIGIKICDSEFQNRGYGKRLLSMMIYFLFESPVTKKETGGLEKVILDTNLENRRAQHVYESLGFKKRKENINSWKDQLGKWQSSVEYELSREDFIYYPRT